MVGLDLGLLPVLAILVFDFCFLLVVTVRLGFHFRLFLVLLRETRLPADNINVAPKTAAVSFARHPPKTTGSPYPTLIGGTTFVSPLVH